MTLHRIRARSPANRVVRIEPLHLQLEQNLADSWGLLSAERVGPKVLLKTPGGADLSESIPDFPKDRETRFGCGMVRISETDPKSRIAAQAIRILGTSALPQDRLSSPRFPGALLPPLVQPTVSPKYEKVPLLVMPLCSSSEARDVSVHVAGQARSAVSLSSFQRSFCNSDLGTPATLLGLV